MDIYAPDPTGRDVDSDVVQEHSSRYSEPPALPRSLRELVESLGSPLGSHTSTSPRPERSAPPSPPLMDDPIPFEDEPLGFGISCSRNLSDPGQNTEHDVNVIREPSPPIPFNFIQGDRTDSDPPTNDPIDRDIEPLQERDLNSPREQSPLQRDHTDPDPPPTNDLVDLEPEQYTPNLPQWQDPVPARMPSPAWTRPSDPFSHPDRFSRTTAHTTICQILFNFDLDAATATDLIEDACHTARQVGVSTHDLLSRSVFLGTTDLGMTPLCLEASRVDLGGGLELVLWLIENTKPSDVHREVVKGCLMRLGGMGEQSVWNVLRGFIPEPEDRPTNAYDVEVEDVLTIPAAPAVVQEEDELIESEFLDQADIETLKSSSDGDLAPIPPRIHRARIMMPLITEPTDRKLKAEWIHHGRLWGLSMGETSLSLTLRQASSPNPDPVYVHATVRLWPLDMRWGAAEQCEMFPLYECELGERELVVGSSIRKTGIRVSMFSLMELVGPHGGVKLEVVVRVRERDPEPEVEMSDVEDDADWQLIDD
ncbi:unnamed protein product [Rhizoctonia solani]|uniref:Uncharacterized protein n=1 Tax=Rhizoctonia solani TaxID=456999 RepID=A0A8H3EC99_9AGAM|nr:unnamed protein product [Rhizoctonia solani]